MPRKVNKIEQSYWLLEGNKEVIDQIISEKSVSRGNSRSYDLNWKIKYYSIIDYITSIYFNDKDSTLEEICSKFVNVNQRFMAGKLGIDNTQIASILDNLIEYKILSCDNICEVANKSNNKLGKSYGYKINNYCSSKIVKVDVLVPMQINNRLDIFEISNIKDKNLINYKKILDKISLNTKSIKKIKKTILNNRYKKLFSNTKYNLKYNSNKTTNNTIVYPLMDVLVPGTDTTTLNKKEVQLPLGCQLLINFVNTLDTIEEDDKTIARIDRAIYMINNQKMIPNRKKKKDSRVYCELTNLNREMKKIIRINGKQIIGLDIRNSQPLIFAVRLKLLFKGEEIPVDVQNYINDCEVGVFYDYFMNALNITEKDMRSIFKGDFFNRVFFSKHIEKDNELKKMFREKYPTVWNIICDEKGGMYSNDFNEFAITLQMIEAQIMFDTVQVQLMNMGIDCYNNFDSLYVTSIEEYEIAKKITLETFQALGVNPTINPEFYNKEQIDSEPVLDLETVEVATNQPEVFEVLKQAENNVYVNSNNQLNQDQIRILKNKIYFSNTKEQKEIGRKIKELENQIV